MNGTRRNTNGKATWSIEIVCNRVLKLSVVWSYTINNGGFHVFKADLVTLSFYPELKLLIFKDLSKKLWESNLHANYLSKEVTPKSGSVNQNGNDEQMNLSVNSEQMQVESSYKDDMGRMTINLMIPMMMIASKRYRIDRIRITRSVLAAANLPKHYITYR